MARFPDVENDWTASAHRAATSRQPKRRCRRSGTETPNKNRTPEHAAPRPQMRAMKTIMVTMGLFNSISLWPILSDDRPSDSEHKKGDPQVSGGYEREQAPRKSYERAWHNLSIAISESRMEASRTLFRVGFAASLDASLAATLIVMWRHGLDLSRLTAVSNSLIQHSDAFRASSGPYIFNTA